MVAFVGTTMAAATFLSRPLFIQAKGWVKGDMALQTKDARNAVILIFIISGSIMIISMSTLYKDGKTVERVLDMVGTLEPIAGKFALAIFLIGTLSAGLSSIFPILMISPLMLADYQSGKLDMNSRNFKIITAVAAVVGLIGPAYGGNPIELQIFTQIFLVFVLPIVILSMWVLVNRKSLMGEFKAGLLLNIGLALAFVFSVLITFNGAKDIAQTIGEFMG
jgi:manganese transport protein